MNVQSFTVNVRVVWLPRY